LGELAGNILFGWFLIVKKLTVFFWIFCIGASLGLSPVLCVKLNKNLRVLKFSDVFCEWRPSAEMEEIKERLMSSNMF
jgi:hypothetical protein